MSHPDEPYFSRIPLSHYSGPGPDVRGRDGFPRHAPWPFWIETDFQPMRREYEYPYEMWQWRSEFERDRFNEALHMLDGAEWGIVQANRWCFGVLDEALAYTVAVALDFQVRKNT